MNKKYLTIEELAQRMRISIHTARCRISEGKPMPPSIRVGRRRLFPEDVFEKWMTNHLHSTEVSGW